MKAIVLRKNGGIDNLIPDEVEVPEIQPDEVLIRVRAISINPVDAFLRQNKQALTGIMRPAAGQEAFILGWDVSGNVVKTGKSVTGLESDDVFGMVNFPGQGRAYAEFVAAPAGQLAIKPANISHLEAAAASLAALTAWQALVTNAKVQKGEKVLIHAAAGGVGHFAVQIAKHFGAHVVGTASAANKDFVLALGADEFIDYSSTRFEDKVNDADVVLESIGESAHLLHSIDAVKRGGRIVSIKGSFDEEATAKAKAKDITAIRMGVKSNGEDMKQIAALLEKHIIKPHISSTYTFEDLPQAHQQIETGRTRGKIVVSV